MSRSGSQVDPRGWDRGLTELAGRQYAVFSGAQAAALGVASWLLPKWHAKGRVFRIHRGVYSIVPPALLTTNGRRMAAVLACGPGAVLSHRSAAALHGLMRTGGTGIEVTVPSRAGRGRPEIIVHRSATLRDTDTTVVDGLPCTTVARTALDLADRIRRRQLERLLDEAVALDIFDLAAMEDQIRHNAARPGAARALHQVLAEHRAGSTITDGAIGEQLLQIVRAVGLPDPEVQPWLDLGDGEPMIRPDFLWRAAKVIVETDGGVHRRGRRVARDARRDQRAARAGYETLRITKDDLDGEPARVGATVLAVVERSSSGPAPASPQRPAAVFNEVAQLPAPGDSEARSPSAVGLPEQDALQPRPRDDPLTVPERVGDRERRALAEAAQTRSGRTDLRRQ